MLRSWISDFLVQEFFGGGGVGLCFSLPCTILRVLYTFERALGLDPGGEDLGEGDRILMVLWKRMCFNVREIGFSLWAYWFHAEIEQ